MSVITRTKKAKAIRNKISKMRRVKPEAVSWEYCYGRAGIEDCSSSIQYCNICEEKRSSLYSDLKQLNYCRDCWSLYLDDVLNEYLTKEQS